MNTPVELLKATPPPPEAEALEPTERSVNPIPLVPVMVSSPLPPPCPKVIPVPAIRFNVCTLPAPLFV